MKDWQKELEKKHKKEFGTGFRLWSEYGWWLSEIDHLLILKEEEVRKSEKDKIWKWAIENGITDKKSFVALRNYLTPKSKDETKVEEGK